MEEIGQVIVELILQFIFELIADSVWHALPAPARSLIQGLITAGAGVLLGALTCFFLPQPLISDEWLRVAYLAIVPVLLGLAMSAIGRRFDRRNKARTPIEHFGFGWLFAFSFAVTRYLVTG